MERVIAEPHEPIKYMNITFEAFGEILQIIGVAVVLCSQARFWLRAREKCGSLEKAFFEMISTTRVRDDRKVTERSEKELEKKFPEWWALSTYLSEDIRTTIVGLVVTLIGLVIALFEGSIPL